METLHNEMRERALSDARWRHIQENLDPSVSTTMMINFTMTYGYSTGVVDEQ